MDVPDRGTHLIRGAVKGVCQLVGVTPKNRCEWCWPVDVPVDSGRDQ
jgi:hypothetical protein